MTPLRCVTFGDVAMGETGYRWPDPCESPLSAYPVTHPSRCYQEGQRVPGGGWLAPYCAARPKPYQCRVIWIDAWRYDGLWAWNDVRQIGRIPRAWLALSNRKLLAALRESHTSYNPGTVEISRGDDDTVIRARGTKEPLCAIEHGWENTGNPCVATVHRGGQCRTDVPQGPIAMWAGYLLPYMPGTRVECQNHRGGWAPGTVLTMDRNAGTLCVLWDTPIEYVNSPIGRPYTSKVAVFTANNVPHLVRLL